MKTEVFLFSLLCFNGLAAQEPTVNTARDGFIGIATDARAAGQGDIGVATAADAFSQFWNPAKYVFSEKRFELGITQILGNNRGTFNDFNQANITFYNKLNDRSAYGLSFRGYSNRITEFQIVLAATEIAIDGSYALRLADTFAMSVAGRFISLKGKVPRLGGFEDGSSLYGIDVSGFYYGNEIAYKNFNGRWRAGFHFANLRGKSLNDTKDIEIYAPTTVKVGTGFDFIFNQDKLLGITTEYTTLLDSYVMNADGEQLAFGLNGSVAALGLVFVYKEKLTARTGYSHGINRPTDSFASIGAGLKGRFVDADIAVLLGLSEDENPIRNKLRISLSLNLEEVISSSR